MHIQNSFYCGPQIITYHLRPFGFPSTISYNYVQCPSVTVSYHVLESASINSWLQRDLNSIQLQDLVHHKTKEVNAPLIPQQVRAILPDFLQLINRPIFRQVFERTVQKADGQELAVVAEVHKESVIGYGRITQSIKEGMKRLSVI